MATSFFEDFDIKSQYSFTKLKDSESYIKYLSNKVLLILIALFFMEKSYFEIMHFDPS